MLTTHGPDVLCWTDGPEQTSAVGTCISSRRKTEDTLLILQQLIRADPNGVRIADRRGNLPIHQAIRCGQPLPVIQALVSSFPEGLQTPNFHGQLPLDLCFVFAGTDNSETEQILDFLHHVTFGWHNQQHAQFHHTTRSLAETIGEAV